MLDRTETDFAGISLSECCSDTMDCEVATVGTSGGMKSACMTLNGRSGRIERLAGSGKTCKDSVTATVVSTVVM